MDVPLAVAKSADALSAKGSVAILACALAAEEKAARDGGAWVARVGLGARLPLPEGQLVSFGLAGALVAGLPPGTLVTARQVVDADGIELWEDDPLPVPGAVTGVVCSAGGVVDAPLARDELARKTGAVAVDMESAALAATGRLAGVVRAVSDTPDQPIGRLAQAAKPDGRTDWTVLVRALLAEPRATLRSATAARRALQSLRAAAEALAPRATP